MGINERGRGIPLVFCIFTPKKDAKAAHASYDTGIITELLTIIKTSMGKNKEGDSFNILIGNTDNDTRERAALASVFPDIGLVLCMFHTWQAWRSGLDRTLKVIPKGPSRQEVRKRLGSFLMLVLKDITVYEEALTAYNKELKYFRSLGTAHNSQINKKKSKGGLAFLAYFKNYLAVRSFWMSWSKAGVIEAARRLGLPVSKIPRTTNHLESFNGRLKGKYYEAYHRSGRLPRIDTWVHVLLSNVMPDFFAEVDELESREDYYHAMRFAPPAVRGPEDALPFAAMTTPSAIPTLTSEISDQMEEDMLQEVLDDGEDSSADEEDLEGNKENLASKSELEDGDEVGYDRFSLRVDPDGNTSSFSADSESDSELPGLWDDNAVDGSSILRHLDITLDFPFTPGQVIPSSESELDTSFDFLGCDLVSLKAINLNGPTSPGTYSNIEATTWQEVLAAEDSLVDRLRALRMVSTDPHVDNLVSPHVSPSIAARLLNWSPKSLPTVLGHTDPSPTFSSPVTSHNFSQHIFDAGLPLEPQRKERRKESHHYR
jgi:hypothetical protein